MIYEQELVIRTLAVEDAISVLVRASRWFARWNSYYASASFQQKAWAERVVTYKVYANVRALMVLSSPSHTSITLRHQHVERLAHVYRLVQ